MLLSMSLTVGDPVEQSLTTGYSGQHAISPGLREASERTDLGLWHSHACAVKEMNKNVIQAGAIQCLLQISHSELTGRRLGPGLPR